MRRIVNSLRQYRRTAFIVQHHCAVGYQTPRLFNIGADLAAELAEHGIEV